MASTRDWSEWHRRYDDPTSSLSARLATVQSLVRDALDAAPPGPVRVVSICAGQGRDLLGAIANHPRRDDVRARLLELDARNTSVARGLAKDQPGIEVVTGDAATTDAYRGAVPADLVLVCGVLGNISDDDIQRTVAALPELCGAGARVIWTRHRRPPDLTPAIRSWFAAAGFDEIAFVAPGADSHSVGAHCLVAAPRPLGAGRRLFTFVGYDNLLGDLR